VLLRNLGDLELHIVALRNRYASSPYRVSRVLSSAATTLRSKIDTVFTGGSLFKPRGACVDNEVHLPTRSGSSSSAVIATICGHSNGAGEPSDRDQIEGVAGRFDTDQPGGKDSGKRGGVRSRRRDNSFSASSPAVRRDDTQFQMTTR